MGDRRDPTIIGYEWAAWWALQGDEPLELVHQCAVDLQRRLGELSHRLHGAKDIEGSEVASAAQLFMIALAELLDDNGTSEFKAEIKRRARGKPIDRTARANKGHKAAAVVQSLVDEGWKQEAALEEARNRTGLSRAEIMAWLKHRRLLVAKGPPNSSNSQD